MVTGFEHKDTKDEINPHHLKQSEAQKLKEIYNFKKQKLGINQVILAERNKTSTGTIFSYLNGKAPLNYEIASFFAKNLEVEISDFSPRLSEKLTAMISFNIPVFTEINELGECISKNIKPSDFKNIDYKQVVSTKANSIYYKLNQNLKSFDGGIPALLPKGVLALMQPVTPDTQIKNGMIALVNSATMHPPISAEHLDNELMKRGLQHTPIGTLLSIGALTVKDGLFIFSNFSYVLAELRVTNDVIKIKGQSEHEVTIEKSKILAIATEATHDGLVV